MFQSEKNQELDLNNPIFVFYVNCELKPPISAQEYIDSIQKKFKNEDWDKIKGQYCKDNGIDLHIDDTLIYNNYFTTPFARLWSHNGKPKYTNKDIRHID